MLRRNTSRLKRVGIFAGTFDPIHEGHLAFARDAIDKCGLDKVFFMVEPRPRRKQGVRAVEHRIRMVQLAIANEKQFGSIVLGQPNFSVSETLPKLEALFKDVELYMLMGEDVVQHLADWPHIERLLQATQFVVAARAGDEHEIERQLDTVQKTRGMRFSYSVFVPSQATYSSSKIRRALKHHQEPEGLPEEIKEYIEEQGLYAPLAQD